MDAATKRIALPDEEPEIFSSVLEYLYKGDYFPRLVHNKRRNSWEIEPTTEEEQAAVESTVYHRGVDGDLLKDTVIYCAAEKYGLDELKKMALRKQGLREFLVVSSCLQSSNPTRIRYSVQHHLGFCQICICQHARHRLQAPCTLSRPHHSLTQYIQTKWHHAT